ncbi:Box C/D snoRNA accumulation [Emydomyces testavorans]|uniref:Box C/D snoRNA protein 1 n=1 Tax=Emydomyces testavorans TaxID=2070801 RepID=A0AAF0IHY7_9EURO|nr:Box C/D snoRNA accumulation [Emydomyces testavorans]
MIERNLSELCTICHINVPKYTCPRCSTRTCSLPCAKRHKLWSQCSGVRDPAAYLKRKDLATPAAFDKDFNFISGIERFLERTDRDVQNRGLVLDDGETAAKKRRTGYFSRDASLLRGIEESGVDVIRAPKGMTRSKQNMSKWHKTHKCLNWTLEWIFPDGQRLVTRCLETITIGTAFSRTAYANEHKLIVKERKKSSIKKEVESVTAGSMPDLVPIPETAEGAPQNQREHSHTLKVERLQSSTEESVPKLLSLDPTENKDSSLRKTTTPKIDPKIHFYLQRPRSRTKIPVLIPLSSSMTLTEALRGRKVLEFPTFYALSLAPDKLTHEGYMLNEEYLKQYGAEETMLEEQRSEAGESVGTDIMDVAQKLENIDDSKILEVLKKDLSYGE